jgi:hypothetical protein
MKISLLNYFTAKPKDISSEVYLRSLEVPLGKTVSPGRFVSGYGTKAASQILQEARKKAMKEKLAFYRVDLQVEGGEIPTSRVTLEDLPGLSFLNLERITAEIAEQILDIVAQENESLEDETAMSLLGKHPDRFDLLWKHSDFKHISTFSWNAPVSKTGPKRFVKLAITRNVSLLENIVIRNYNFENPKISFIV